MKKPVQPAESEASDRRPGGSCDGLYDGRSDSADSDHHVASCPQVVGEWREGRSTQVADEVICETAVALVYNGISHVVMMATPDYLEDLALGFSLTEGILQHPAQLYDMSVVPRRVAVGGRGADDRRGAGNDTAGDLDVAGGMEIAMDIAAERFALLKQARRNLTGRTGCGLCGAESLEQAIRRPTPVVGNQRFPHSAIERAVNQLEANQPLQAITGAVHGAALCHADGNILLLREDVGRHNALDKLYGALCRQSRGAHQLAGSFVMISSRASYEMVVKAAVMGVEMLVAVSAPTRLAIDLAHQANITLVGFARPGRHMVYTHPQRIIN